MSDLLITNVDVLTDEGVLKNHAIEIENGYITAILKDSEAIKAKDTAKDVLDGKGQLAAPGLVNTHTHIAMGLFRNYADDLELMEWLETAIWPTEAKPRDNTERMPVSFTTSAVVFIKKYMSLKVVVPVRSISAIPSCVP